MRVISKPGAFEKNCNEGLAPFLGISFRDPKAFEQARQQLAGSTYPRESLVSLLLNYNQSILNDAAAMQQIERLRHPQTYCVVTGQQLGFMGGPAYTILKGISCLLAAKEANAVPIFWLATEDHDVAEIDHTYLLDPLGNLQRFRLSFPKEGKAVEDLELSSKNIEICKTLFHTLELPADQWPDLLPSYSQTMVRFMVRLFAGTGMVFLEPKIFRPLAIPFFKKEIEASGAIQDTLKRTTDRLQAAGGQAILPIGEGINLFIKTSEGRRRLKKDAAGIFAAGSERYPMSELIALVEKEPERFSPSAASRPILQSALLPVLAYVAGPAEMSYHRQLGDYYQLHGIPMPCIIPRQSATLIPPYAAELLQKAGLQPWDEIPHHWPELMPELRAGEEALEADWQQSAAMHFGNDLSSEMRTRYVKLAGRKLLRKVVKMRLRKKKLPGNGLHLLRNLIHPHDKLQERVINWWGFQARASENLILESIKELTWKPGHHHYLYFS